MLKRLCTCKLPENSPGQEYPVPRRRIQLPRVNFSAPPVTSVQMPLPPQNFASCVLYHSDLASWDKAMTCTQWSVQFKWYMLRKIILQQSWPHLEAYADCAFRESAAGTVRHVHWDAAHMLVHLLVVPLAFLLPNARRSWQGSKACTKTCTTRRGSGHVDVEQIKRDDNKQS